MTHKQAQRQWVGLQKRELLVPDRIMYLTGNSPDVGFHAHLCYSVCELVQVALSRNRVTPKGKTERTCFIVIGTK